MGASQRDNGTSKAFMRNTRDLDALGGVRTIQAAISLEAAVEEFTPPLTHTLLLALSKYRKARAKSQF